jgi:hypothetical protein
MKPIRNTVKLYTCSQKTEACKDCGLNFPHVQQIFGPFFCHKHQINYHCEEVCINDKVEE